MTTCRAALIVLALGSACVTVPEVQYRQEIPGLTQMSLSYIYKLWGQPDFRLPKSKETSLKYKNIEVNSENFEPRTICTVELTCDKELIVTAWRYTNCVQVPRQPSKDSR